MSQYLESLLGKQRQQECVKHDAELAAAEQARAQTTEKADTAHRRNDQRALELQVADFRARGWM